MYLPFEDTVKIVPSRVSAMVSEANNLVRKNFKLVPATQDYISPSHVLDFDKKS